MTNVIVGHNFLWNPLTYLSKMLGIICPISMIMDHGDSGADDMVNISADGEDAISVDVMRMTKMPYKHSALVMMRPSPVPSVYTRARSTVYLNFRICALVTRGVLPKDEY